MSFKDAVEAVPEELKNGAKAGLIKTSAGLTIYGVTINDWVAILTGTYFVLQIGLLLIKYREELPKIFHIVRRRNGRKK